MKILTINYSLGTKTGSEYFTSDVQAEKFCKALKKEKDQIQGKGKAYKETKLVVSVNTIKI